MIGVYAPMITTEVIEVKAIWQRGIDELLPQPAMPANGYTVLRMELSIAATLR